MNIAKLVTSGLLLSILMLGMTLFGRAQTHHTVKKGETLFSIAKQYNVEVQQLKEWNNLRGNNLSLGRSLVIKKASSSSKNATTHTVKPHETLFSISKQYHVNISEIKSWNNLSSNSLNVGQRLTIYSPNKTTQKKQAITVDKQTRDNTYYTVKNGDTIFRIAKQHGMGVDKLKSLNDLSSNNIRVGQRLTVYGDAANASSAKLTESSPQGKFVSYKIRGSSTTLQKLLPKFGMDEEEFRALNPAIHSSQLQAGQQVNMLAPPTKEYQNPYLTNANMKDLGSTPVSHYNGSEKATPTTNGELYNPDALTAAHPNIALGSVIFIQNPQNQQGTFVRINDRTAEQKLKLSAAAWKSLHFSRNKPKVTIYQAE